MTLAEFKQAILDNSLSVGFKILLCSENHFIANQYVEAISTRYNLPITKINSLAEAMVDATDMFFDLAEAELRVLSIDLLDEVLPDYSQLTNTIVICDKIDTKLKPAIAEYIIEIPKLIDWQIFDYIKTVIPNITDNELQYFYKVTNNDIYRIDSELSKVRPFSIKERQAVLRALLADTNSDLYTDSVYTLKTAILNKDKLALMHCLYARNNSDFEPTGLVTMLFNEFKKLAVLKLSTTEIDWQAADCKSEKQANYLRKNCNIYTNDQIVANLDFLSSIDYKLKNGDLELTRDQFLDYIICKVMR